MKFDKLLRKHGIGNSDLKFFKKLQGKYTPNSEYLWSGSDSKQAHLDSEKTYPEKFKYWKDRSITYKYNNLGFRSDFDFKPGMQGDLYLGCSFTEGVGLPNDRTWVSFLSKQLGTPAFNLGTGGWGIETCFRYLIAAYIFGLKFKNVFVLAPPPNRYEQLIDDNHLFKSYLSTRHQEDKTLNTLPSMMNHYWSDEVILNKMDKFLVSFLIGGRNNSLANTLRTVLAMQAFTIEAGANFHYYTYEELSKLHHFKAALKSQDKQRLVPARDGHWASYYHRYLTGLFLTDYPNLTKSLI